MEQKEALRAEIVGRLLNKASIKQDIAGYSEQMFEVFRKIASEEVDAMRAEVTDSRIRLRVEENGTFEFTLFVGSDVLVFHLHQNVFQLPEDHPLWNEDYLKDTPENGYFAVINIYNFLAESYERSRINDVGYLIGRVFMNREQKCLVEGKGQLGDLFKDVAQCELTEEAVRTILQVAMMYAMDFDLVTPPYELVQEVTVMQIQEISSDLQLATGKRLGFKFASEDNTSF